MSQRGQDVNFGQGQRSLPDAPGFSGNCRAQLGKQPNTFTTTQLQDLLKIKQSLGIPDPRYGLKECELCDNAEWRPGVQCGVPTTPGGNGSSASVDSETEEAVQRITDLLMEQLSKTKS